MSLQQKSNFDNEFNNTRRNNNSISKITIKLDKSKGHYSDDFSALERHPIRPIGTQIGNPWKLINFSNFFNSRKTITSLQSINISIKKLVKRFFVNIDIVENSKTKIPDSYKVFFK